MLKEVGRTRGRKAERGRCSEGALMWFLWQNDHILLMLHLLSLVKLDWLAGFCQCQKLSTQMYKFVQVALLLLGSVHVFNTSNKHNVS